jgi:homoserine/homoserine lactone efflux protein
VIDPGLYLAFVAAVAVLVLIPGPNVALIVANSVAYGTRFGLLTVAGTSTAMVGQLALTAFGMTAVLGVLADWFEWIRWLGVFYLVWLGVRAWRAPAADLTRVRPQPKSARAIFLRGVLVSATNPKTLLFYSAFFPQFVTMGAHVEAQIAILSVTFLVVAATLDGTWALAAGRARHLLAAHGRLRNRVTGTLLIGAGVGLALARRS